MKMLDRKKKFLEDYFSLCVEHGFCIDWNYFDTWDIHKGVKLCLSDWPQYPRSIYERDWDCIKDELKESLND